MPTQVDRDFDGLRASVADCEYGGLIRSIEAIDVDTVRFSLCRSDVLFLFKVAHPGLGVLPSEYLESSAGGLALVETPIGTGPFLLERWDAGTQIVLASNSNYWGGVPAAEAVVVRWNSDAGERLAELRSGAVDAIVGVAPEDFDTISDDADLQLLQNNPLNTMYLGMNHDRDPLSDVRVRRAIALAIDRDHIVESYYPSGSVPAEQLLPRAASGYASQVINHELDIERAAELLIEAGYEEGLEMVLSYSPTPTSYLPDPDGVAEEIKLHLQALQISVTLEALDPGDLERRANLGELDLFLSGTDPLLPNAASYYEPNFGAQAPPRFGAEISGFQETLARASETSDLALRRELYGEAAELLREEIPMLPIAHGATATVWLTQVSGANSSPLNAESFAEVSSGDRDVFIWMQPTEPQGLYCADETSADATRVCAQITESLLRYQLGGIGVEAGLAVSWRSDQTFTEWTFELRENVVFHDGTDLDANDVVLSYLAQWDKSHPLHSGRTGQFAIFSDFFDALAESTS